MNRLRNKMKAKEAKDDSSASRTSNESDHSSLPSFKSFRKAKKSLSEEPKKEFDLSAALPSTDVFRTSLLMTNLSARFSMLREQDDPNTKIGKASDDSVLYPQRQSRLDMGFGGGLHGLSDIAEVESIKASTFLRANSFVSDDTDSTKGGSVLNRTKPIEGNNLFGGRQKIYRIPAGASAKNSEGGGLGGRILYDDDVALSAFQRWRLAEKEKNAQEEDDKAESEQAEEEAEPTRSESPPPVGYNRKRETSSTTSSASAIARNSTAATSVMSGPTPSVKDWQSASTAPTSATSTPGLERSVTRTRRLYEQGLTQDMHEQQTSALSRIDSLARQRTIGTRTPDAGPSSPSPTTGFADRFASDKRTILTKGSAPNLRSFTPPTTGSPVSAMDLGIKVPTQPEPKLNFGGSPPLSPPISETGEHPILPIQPNDLGKATAMGLFQKPSQPYDESKYAQRQIQLQQGQGRDSPSQRFRAESNASFATDRSRSSSSAQRQPFEAKSDAVKPEPPLKEDTIVTTFLDVSEASVDVPQIKKPAMPRLNVEHSSEMIHPAFRQSAMPTPLSVSGKLSNEPSPISENPNISVANSEQPSPEDSPTLGPTTGAGLSGMVRQHLRTDSNTSSVYGAAPQSGNLDSRFPLDPYESRQDGLEAGAKSNPWMSSEQDWTLSYYGEGPSLERLKALAAPKEETPSESKETDRASSTMEDANDEFANQLANARRRVRERLTSYVESDSSRAASPARSEKDLAAQQAQPAQSSANPLGIAILRPKSSRGSLIDKTRSVVVSQTKAMKMLGIGGAMSISPSPTKLSFDEKEIAPLATMEEEAAKDEPPQPESQDDANAHPGLRAFRQARRELQRRKELETLARHQAAQTALQQGQSSEQPSVTRSPPRGERSGRQRTPSRERKPPPVTYRQRAPSDESSFGMNTNSQSASRANGERERSSSETSQGQSAPQGRLPRLRNNTGPQDDQLAPNAPRQPTLRSPGLPGTDIRRSPHMPPQGYAGQGAPSGIPSPSVLDKSRSMGNLAVHSNRPGYDSSALPSPISPLNGSTGLPPSPYGMSPAGTPTSLGPRPRQPSAPQSPAVGAASNHINDSMKRVVNKREISEPTFIMSTSRVPTVNLRHQASTPDVGSYRSRSQSGSRSRSNSRGGPPSAPPVPPINPRRKREGSRPPHEESGISAPHPSFANQTNSTVSLDSVDENRRAFPSGNDEHSGKSDFRQRLRKFNGDGHGPSSLPLGSRRDNTPPINIGPPASRTVVTSGMKSSISSGMGNGMGMPGGMF
ncbi:hypothetical protein QBC46DRAFT_255877 [Diplogelasinospora grovesii]|uniref:Uncharacterized protein n=1 Tax=Diplogelasinospora grovesii TaxID=303347 RepID=A0AAN6NBD0_9PEZI|nr:hypothetical protein QBC46DRAFT_255877 [Diplogelasinospora grovesii]